MESVRAWIVARWKSVSTIGGALILLSGSVVAGDKLGERFGGWFPASRNHVASQLQLAASQLEEALKPIRRSQVKSELRDLKASTRDLEGQKLQFEGLLQDTAIGDRRDAIEQQLEDIEDGLEENGKAVEQLECQAKLLDGATACR